MKSLISKNGVEMTAAEAALPLSSSGFEQSQAVYTSMRTYGKEVFQLDAHLARLEQSAKLIGYELSSSLETIREWVFQLVELAPFKPQFIRVTATPDDIYVNCRHLELEGDTSKGVRALTLPIQRTMVKAKVVGTPGTVWANKEARKAGCYEALLKDKHRNVLTEGAFSNLLWVKDGVLYWCDEALDGITQGLVRELAKKAGFVVKEGTLHMDTLADCQEIFITQTSRGIVPIVQVDETVIGDGAVGPMTRQLMTAYTALLPSS